MKIEQKLKNGKVDNTVYVDQGTGEVLSIERKEHKYITKNKEQFFLMYSALLGVMKEMNKPQIRIFAYLLEKKEMHPFSISKAERIYMSNDIKVNERIILNEIKNMIKMELVYMQDGIMSINPRYVFKGSSSTRDNRLKTIIELELIH